MRDPETDLLYAGFEAINERDIERFLELVDPEVEFNSLVGEADARRFHGHDGVREWWRTVLSSVGGLRFEVAEVRVLKPATLVAKVLVAGEAGGVPVEQTMWQASIQRGERAVWWLIARTEDEVVAAAGEASRRRA